jgi:NAD(P)-dependent dehydrogenase (short-subunit alcohol dehydrogenase family)
MRGWTTADIPDLEGKRAIVTGANSGIGFHTALHLAEHGAAVVIACRSPERGGAALDRLMAEVPKGEFTLASLDLADLSSVRSFAAEQAKGGLDLLVNNAGVMAIPQATTADGFEMQIGTNHLGHFALTGLLLPALLEREGARVVTVTSFASWLGKINFDDLQGSSKYGKWRAYGQAKLANLLFAKELNRRVPAIRSVAAHPGYASTNLTGSSAQLSGSRLERLYYSLGGSLLAQSAAAGALPTLYAATDSRAEGGETYGPRGPFAMRGRPTKVRMTPRGNNPQVAARLWDVSAELTGVSYPS